MLRFLSDAKSGWIAILFLLLTALVFSGGWFLSYRNRTKRGVMKCLSCFLGAGIVCEIAWRMLFYPEGEYLNLGLGGAMMGLLFWTVSLLVCFVVAGEVVK